MTLEELRDQWYYIIKTNDGDRYLREVYADWDLVSVVSSREKAELELNELTKHLYK